MSVFSIVLLVLLGLYIGVWSVDRFLITPRRERMTLPELNSKVDELDKRVHDLETSEDGEDVVR